MNLWMQICFVCSAFFDSSSSTVRQQKHYNSPQRETSSTWTQVPGRGPLFCTSLDSQQCCFASCSMLMSPSSSRGAPWTTQSSCSGSRPTGTGQQVSSCCCGHAWCSSLALARIGRTTSMFALVPQAYHSCNSIWHGSLCWQCHWGAAFVVCGDLCAWLHGML